MVCAPVRRNKPLMLYLTCTTITSVDLAHYGISRAKDWVSVDCGTRTSFLSILFTEFYPYLIFSMETGSFINFNIIADIFT